MKLLSNFNSNLGSKLRLFFSFNLLNNSYPFLHGLRSVSLLILIMLHVVQTNSEVLWGRISGFRPTTLFELTVLNMWFSMDCFFLMSGFLVGGILFRTSENARLMASSFMRFWQRRAFREFPIYYFVLILCILVTRYYKLPTSQVILDCKFDFFREFFFLVNYEFNVKKTLMRWTWSLSFLKSNRIKFFTLFCIVA